MDYDKKALGLLTRHEDARTVYFDVIENGNRTVRISIEADKDGLLARAVEELRGLVELAKEVKECTPTSGVGIRARGILDRIFRPKPAKDELLEAARRLVAYWKQEHGRTCVLSVRDDDAANLISAVERMEQVMAFCEKYG